MLNSFSYSFIYYVTNISLLRPTGNKEKMSENLLIFQKLQMEIRKESWNVRKTIKGLDKLISKMMLTYLNDPINSTTPTLIGMIQETQELKREHMVLLRQYKQMLQGMVLYTA